MSNGLMPETQTFLEWLRGNPSIRSSLRAPHDQTLLYAGSFIRPMWADIAEAKRQHPETSQKKTLPDVLATLPGPGGPGSNLLAHVQELETKVPWRPDGFIVWRALSGIFASNASGAVSFLIGSGVSPNSKVFAATELAVLERNPQIDSLTRDVLSYYRRCIESNQLDPNFGFISG